MVRTFVVTTPGGALGGHDTQSLSLALKWYFEYPEKSSLFLQLDSGDLQELEVPAETKTIDELMSLAQARIPTPELTYDDKFEVILGLRKMI